MLYNKCHPNCTKNGQIMSKKHMIIHCQIYLLYIGKFTNVDSLLPVVFIFDHICCICPNMGIWYFCCLNPAIFDQFGCNGYILVNVTTAYK